MTDDTLSRVLLSASAVERWLELTRSPAVRMLISGTPPEEIPDELARVEPDGSLTIYVSLPRGLITMRVEPHEWRWRTPEEGLH